jgi:hypothetical protein
MMVHGSMRWGAAVTAAALFAGSAQALEFQLSDSIVDLRFDEYGAIGYNFVNDTQLLGATEPPASPANVDMVFAGAVYLPQYSMVLGSTSLKGRSGITNPALTSTGPNSVSSTYMIQTGPDRSQLGVRVDTSLTSPGLMHQTYTFEYFDIVGDTVGGDNDVIFAGGIPLLITYMLDPDIGAYEDDDSGSVASGTARAWDEDFANPGSATLSGFNDPMIEMRALLNGANPDELGTHWNGSFGMLNDLDDLGTPLSTDDVDGPGDDDDGAYGARWAQIDLSPLNPTATLDVDIQFGGPIPPDEKPIPEPVTATLSVMALGALAWRTTRRRGHDA